MGKHEVTVEKLQALDKWVKRQRTLKRQGRLSRDKIEALESIGFCWDDPVPTTRKTVRRP